MGDTIPLLLEQTMQIVGTNRASDAHEDNGTVGGPGPCKKRRVLNTLELARMRLEYLCDEDGENGLCQHAVWDDLKDALKDLRQGQEVFQYITRQQWGDQVAQGATRTGSQKNGDRCWGFLLQEGEELREEESQLDYVHPADVVALSEGAQGDATAMIDLLLRNAQLVMHFVPIGGEQFRQLMAAIVVWRQRNSGGSIFVDTQTTDKGEQEQPPPLDSEKWVPPLDG
ncbi:unnamed protein product, partial [Symbiodinium sp. KB8]